MSFFPNILSWWIDFFFQVQGHQRRPCLGYHSCFCLLSISLLLHIIYIFFSIVSIQSLIVMNISHHQITSFHLMLLPVSLFLFVTNLPKIRGFHIFAPHTARLLKSVLLFTHFSDLFFTKMKENIFIHNFLSPSAFDTADPLTTLFKSSHVWFPAFFPQSLLWTSYSFSILQMTVFSWILSSDLFSPCPFSLA